MQIIYKIKIIIFFALCIFCIQPSYSQQNKSNLLRADSLFKRNELIEAEKIYLKLTEENSEKNEAILTKLAYIAKRKNDWPAELKYLNSLNHINSSPKISKRLEEIGQKRKLNEYEIGLWDRIRWVYFQYFPFIALILLIPLVYSVFILVQKRIKKQKIKTFEITYLMIYTLFLALFFNLPNFFEYGMIKPLKSYMREYDSSGASIKKIIPKGSKILLLKEGKIWVYCMNDGNLGYILKNDIEKF